MLLVVVIPGIRKSVEDEVKIRPKDMVTSAISYADYCSRLADAGTITKEKAVEMAVEYIRNTRTGGEEGQLCGSHRPVIQLCCSPYVCGIDRDSSLKA